MTNLISPTAPNRSESFFTRTDRDQYKTLVGLARLVGFDGSVETDYDANSFSLNYYTNTEGSISSRGIGFSIEMGKDYPIEKIYAHMPEKTYEEAIDFFNYFREDMKERVTDDWIDGDGTNISDEKTLDKLLNKCQGIISKDKQPDTALFIRNNRLIERYEIEIGYFSQDGLFCVTDYSEFTIEMLEIILDKLKRGYNDND